MLQEMRTSVGWTLLMLLGCRLSCATHVSPNTCPYNVRLKTVCTPGGERVSVPCPNVTADEITFKLFKEHELISNVTCFGENNTLKCRSLHPRAGVEVAENKWQKSMDFILTGLTESSFGTYRCEGLVIFPPPLRKVPSAEMILVEGHPCRFQKETSKDISNCDDNPSLRFHWIWILVVALLSIYSGTVTVIAIVIWVRMRNEASQSDYMNTKPRATRDGRKKRGIQKPIPRHF